MNNNARLDEQAHIVVGLPPRTPSTSTPDYVCLKGYDRCSVVISVDNGATVTGSAIALYQAQDASNTNGKALSFTRMLANTDIDASDVMTETAVASNTFTTGNTDNKNLLYVVDVKATDLDVDGGFDWVRASTGNATNAVVSIVYVLYGAKYKKPIAATAIA